MAEKLIDAFVNLAKVKSLVTLSLTLGMLLLLSGKWNPSQEILALYCTSYGAVMTYYFTKDKSKTDEDAEASKAELYTESVPYNYPIATGASLTTSDVGYDLDAAEGEFTEDEPKE